MSRTPNQDELLDFFRGLANENRQKIIFAIFVDKDEHTVGEIASALGLAPSTTSTHLAQLKRAGILVSEKRNKEVYYKINKERIELFVEYIGNWLTCC